MTDLSPFHYPIPKKFLSDPELRQWVTYLHKHLQQTWVKLGGSEDAIETTVVRDAYDSTMYASGLEEAFRRIECLEKRNLYQPVNEEALKKISELENGLSYGESPKIKELTTKTIDREEFTATDFMFVNATNNSTLTLPANPVTNSIVIFTKDATRFKLKGNGKKVNGSFSDIVFYKERLARQVHYFIDVDEWFFI